MDNIKFSVLIPVYNVEKYLSNCLESVITQTYQNFEIILVDDGSTDNSGKICDEYAQKYEKIHVFHKPNQGQLSARSFAIQKATGDWYVFLDSDDTLAQEALQTIFEKVNEYNCDCVIYKWQRVLDGKIIDAIPSDVNQDIIIQDKCELYNLVFNDSNYNSLCRKACKATLFDGRDYSCFYNIKYGEDLLQSIEILQNATKTVFVDKILYNYRYNPNSIVNNIKLESIPTIFSAFDEVIKMLENESAFKEKDFVKLFNNRMVVFVNRVINVFNMDATYEDKIFTIKQLKSSLLFRRLLSYKNEGKLQRNFLFYLYVREQYKLLSIICNFRATLVKIKHKVIKK